MTDSPPTLRGVSDLRAFFRTNETPVFFVSPTAFNLLGIDRWVRNFHDVTYFDSFEGGHPNVFVPKEREARDFRSIEDICNHLLGHAEVIDRVRSHGPNGKAVFVIVDEETEALAADAGLQTDDNRLEERCREWIRGVRSQFAGTPLTQQQPPVGPLAFKMA